MCLSVGSLPFGMHTAKGGVSLLSYSFSCMFLGLHVMSFQLVRVQNQGDFGGMFVSAAHKVFFPGTESAHMEIVNFERVVLLAN